MLMSVSHILLGCGGGCIAGATVGAVFLTGIIVTVTVLTIMVIRKRKKNKVIAGMSIWMYFIMLIGLRKKKHSTSTVWTYVCTHVHVVR